MNFTQALFNSQKSKGLTLLELAIVIGIFSILIILTFAAFKTVWRSSDLGNCAEEIVNTLRSAQNKTQASEGASQYGVYFDNLASPQKYTLFSGRNYSSRSVSLDQIHNVPEFVEIYEIDLWSGKEVVFEKLTGYASSASSYGKISIRLKSDLSRVKTIYIENSGLIGLDLSPALPDSWRITDSRHIHFNYSREIATSTEKLKLDFPGVSQEIAIASNMQDNQIYWEGTINVEGVLQKIKIHTHKLNDPDTQFCVHRDKRYSNKALSISISGDTSGNLISYTADGQESKGSSVYLIGDPQRQ